MLHPLDRDRVRQPDRAVRRRRPTAERGRRRARRSWSRSAASGSRCRCRPASAPAAAAAAPRRRRRSASAAQKAGAAASGDSLTAPMQGTIVKVAVADGDTVEAGRPDRRARGDEDGAAAHRAQGRHGHRPARPRSAPSSPSGARHLRDQGLTRPRSRASLRARQVYDRSADLPSIDALPTVRDDGVAASTGPRRAMMRSMVAARCWAIEAISSVRRRMSAALGAAARTPSPSRRRPRVRARARRGLVRST